MTTSELFNRVYGKSEICLLVELNFKDFESVIIDGDTMPISDLDIDLDSNDMATVMYKYSGVDECKYSENFGKSFSYWSSIPFGMTERTLRTAGIQAITLS